MNRNNKVAELLDELRHGPFPHLIVALVFEGSYQEIKKQFPDLTREGFMQIVRDLDAEYRGEQGH